MWSLFCVCFVLFVVSILTRLCWFVRADWDEEGSTSDCVLFLWIPQNVCDLFSFCVLIHRQAQLSAVMLG